MQDNYYIQFISTGDMEIYEITRTASSRAKLIKEANTVAQNYNLHGYDIDKVKIFNSDKELVVTYNL